MSLIDTRADLLKRIGLGLYADHVDRFGDGKQCGCEKLSSDPDCDVGEALWRMKAREMLRFDGRKVKPMIQIPCDHPRQKAREFSIPAATEEEAELLIYCAVPGCPAGCEYDDLMVSSDYPPTGAEPPPNPERVRRIALRRARVDGIWKWEIATRVDS